MKTIYQAQYDYEQASWKAYEYIDPTSVSRREYCQNLKEKRLHVVQCPWISIYAFTSYMSKNYRMTHSLQTHLAVTLNCNKLAFFV